jgi:two-component system nitrogen regulation response regulator NtrX
MAELAREYGRRRKTFDPMAMSTLRRYRWPGNVREMRNVLERLMIMVPGDTIMPSDLSFLDGAGAVEDGQQGPSIPLHEARDAFERDYILRALAGQQGNISRTADALGVERSNLYRKMKAFGIAPSRKVEEEEEERSTG